MKCREGPADIRQLESGWQSTVPEYLRLPVPVSDHVSSHLALFGSTNALHWSGAAGGEPVPLRPPCPTTIQVMPSAWGRVFTCTT